MKGHVMNESGLAKRDRRRVLQARGVICGHEIGCFGEAWLRKRGDVGDGRRTKTNREEA